MQVGNAEMAILSQYLAPSRAERQSAIHSAAMGYSELMTLVGGKRLCLLMAGDDYEVYDKKPQRYTPKTTEQHLTVRSDKSEVTIIKDCARGIIHNIT